VTLDSIPIQVKLGIVRIPRSPPVNRWCGLTCAAISFCSASPTHQLPTVGSFLPILLSNCGRSVLRAHAADLG
jgi:hypothetical protein